MSHLSKVAFLFILIPHLSLPFLQTCRLTSAKKVETLLAALGRADNAASAMKVLGPHAGKVKQAKEAVPWATDTVDAGVYKTL